MWTDGVRQSGRRARVRLTDLDGLALGLLLLGHRDGQHTILVLGGDTLLVHLQQQQEEEEEVREKISRER